MREPRGQRADYRYFAPITTRWHDNDAYGHINNVVYYSYFDTVVNQFLIAQGLDLKDDSTRALVVSSGCQYHAEAAYPDALEGALKVRRLGNSSVEYGCAVFRQGDPQPAAEGFLVHVFVDRHHRPCPIPAALRAALATLENP